MPPPCSRRPQRATQPPSQPLPRTVPSIPSIAAITNASSTASTCRGAMQRGRAGRQRRGSDWVVGACPSTARRGEPQPQPGCLHTGNLAHRYRPFPPSPPVTTSASRRRPAEGGGRGGRMVRGAQVRGHLRAHGGRWGNWLSEARLVASTGTHSPAARAGAVSALQEGVGRGAGQADQHHPAGGCGTSATALGPRPTGVSPPERKQPTTFTGRTSAQCSPAGRRGAASASWRQESGGVEACKGLQATGKERENGAGGAAAPALVGEEREPRWELREASRSPRRRAGTSH